jgi:hypothetical protein
MKKQAEEYAQLKGTTVLDSKVAPDGQSITFVLESGPKLTMSAEELEHQIEILNLGRERKPAEPFQYIEDAIKAEKPETAAERRKRLKAEAAAKTKAE